MNGWTQDEHGYYYDAAGLHVPFERVPAEVAAHFAELNRAAARERAARLAALERAPLVWAPIEEPSAPPRRRRRRKQLVLRSIQDDLRALALSDFERRVLEAYVGVVDRKHFFRAAGRFVNGVLFAQMMADDPTNRRQVATIWRRIDQVLLDAGYRIRGECVKTILSRDPNGEAALGAPEERRSLP